MSERAEQLQTTAATQVGELIDLISTADDATLRRPCPGREKLGDGTIGAIAAHMADTYQRIGTFVATSQRMANGRAGRHRVLGSLGALGHSRRDHGNDQPSGHGHRDGYTADTVRPRQVAQRLRAASEDLARIGQLTDRQLDAIPPRDSFRFCDGQRTLEQVVAGLLKHQGQQVKKLKATVA